MYLIKLAFNNLKYNFRRTISLIALITMSATSIILYQGYVEYCREGMASGYINNSGHIQIADKNYWGTTDTSGCYIYKTELTEIYDVLNKNPKIKFYDSVLEFSGLIGYNNNSSVFWGKGYDHPDKYYGAFKGLPVFEGDEGILIGKNLAQKLNIKLDMETDYVSVMCNSPESGISLGSLELQGLVDTGIPQNDSGLLISSRQTALNILDMEDAASYIQIYFQNNDDIKLIGEIQEKINEISSSLVIKDWQELNPSYKQVNDMNEAQFFIISLLIGVLIVISIMQTLVTAFLERMGEFGTLEAIGMKKKEIIIMLFLEMLYLFIISSLLAILITLSINKVTDVFNLSMTPPGYDVSYPLVFLFIPGKMFLAFCFVLFCCITASVFPIISIYKNSAIKLINRK